MKTRRSVNIIATFALTMAGFAAATPALADAFGTMPSGCSMSPSAPYIGSASKIYYQGSGHCGSAYEMDVRLVHNYNGLPDVRVKEIKSTGGPNFAGAGFTCDGGGTTQYYDELAFKFNSSGDVQRVSSTVSLTHC